MTDQKKTLILNAIDALVEAVGDDLTSGDVLDALTGIAWDEEDAGQLMWYGHKREES